MPLNRDFVRLYRNDHFLVSSKKYPAIQTLEQSLVDSNYLGATMSLFHGFDAVRWPPIVIKDEHNTFDIWEKMALIYVRERSESLYKFIFFLMQQYQFWAVLPGAILTYENDHNNLKLPGAWKAFSLDTVCDADQTRRLLDKLWFDLEESSKTIFKGNLGVPGMLPSKRDCVYVEACEGESAVAHQDFMMKQNRDNLSLAREEVAAFSLGPGMCGAVFWELTLPASPKFFAYECGGFGQRRWFETLAVNAGRQTAVIEDYDHMSCSSGKQYSLDECKFQKVEV